MSDELQTQRDAGIRRWIPDAAIVAVVVVAAAIVFRWDAALSDRAQNLYHQQIQPSVPKCVIEPFRLLGKTDAVWFFMLFLCWATGNRRLLGRFACAAVPSGLFVLLVKEVVGRPRPTGHSTLSFPSGDSSIAFVWATVLAAEYPVLAVPAFLAAATIALLRVAVGAHYPSDILVGSAIGFIAGRIAVHLVNEVPAWLTRATRRLHWGLLMVAGFAVYVAAKAVFGKPWILILAAVLVPAILVVVGIRKRRAWARIMKK